MRNVDLTKHRKRFGIIHITAYFRRANSECCFLYQNKSHLFDSELKTKFYVNTFENRKEKKTNFFLGKSIDSNLPLRKNKNRFDRVNWLKCAPIVERTMSFETDAKSLTDDFPVCPETGSGFAINQTYKEDGTRQKVHKIYDRSFHSQQIDTRTLVH